MPSATAGAAARNSVAPRGRGSPSRGITRTAASTRPIPSTPGIEGGGPMQLQFHWDDDGSPRARGKGHGRTVAGLLESALQDSPAAAREVLRALDRVESGHAPSW